MICKPRGSMMTTELHTFHRFPITIAHLPNYTLLFEGCDWAVALGKGTQTINKGKMSLDLGTVTHGFSIMRMNIEK